MRLNPKNNQTSIYIEYMYAYKSKRSAYAKRKQTRRRTKVPRKRAGMRKKVYRKNTALIPSAEKKYFDHGFTNLPFAQYNGILNGYLVENITPLPVQGLGSNNRIGSKIFLTGAIMDIQFVSQANSTNQFRYRWYLVRIPDCYDFPATDIVPAMFDSDPFNAGIYNWHSNLDPEKQSQFKIVAQGQGSLRPDSLATQTSRVQSRKYLKLGFDLKWDTAVLLDQSIKNQLRMIVFADSGDSAGASLTGANVSVNLRSFYLDN